MLAEEDEEKEEEGEGERSIYLSSKQKYIR